MLLCIEDKEDFPVLGTNWSHVAALVRSHMSGSVLFKRTIDQNKQQVQCLVPQNNTCYTLRWQIELQAQLN